MGDRTQNVGYVHVSDVAASLREGHWVCAENCPHPEHSAAALYKEDGIPRREDGSTVWDLVDDGAASLYKEGKK